MNRKEIIIQLIEDDIKITRLVFALNKLGFDADPFLIDTHLAVFTLMGIGRDEITEKMAEKYFKMINKGARLKEEKVREYVIEIFSFWENLSK